MIQCKINGEDTKVAATGTIPELAGEIGVLVNKIYQGYALKDKQTAEQFRQVLITGLIMPDSPVWEVEEG